MSLQNWDLVGLDPLRIWLVFICASIFLVHLYKKRKHRMSILQRCGIPGPIPNFWTGNMKECFSMGNVEYDSLLTEKFGEICGYYLGAKPIILISDPELLKIIEVEKSKLFQNRPRRVPGGINPDPKRTEMLGNLPHSKWTETRKVLTKAFTPSKLREMIPQIMTKIDVFMEKIKPGEETDFYPLLQGVTLDIIGQTGFGVDCHIQENIDDQLHSAVKAEFSKSPNSLLVKIYLCLPELAWIMQPIRIVFYKVQELVGMSESSALWETGFKTFEARIGNNSDRRPDIVQQLVDSHLREKPLRVVANCVLFFEAAYETLSSSLAFLVHLLTNHQNVQKRLQEELEQVEHLDFSDATKITEELNKLKYLEAVVKEGLRMYPPQTTFIGRSGDTDFVYEKEGKKYVIPAGVHVQAGLFQVQNSPKYWDKPEEFDPERFLEGNDPSSLPIWQAFGLGPRICIGRSFAWLVLRLLLVNILTKFRLNPSPNTEEKVTLRYKIATMTPMNGSYAFPMPKNNT